MAFTCRGRHFHCSSLFRNIIIFCIRVSNRFQIIHLNPLPIFTKNKCVPSKCRYQKLLKIKYLAYLLSTIKLLSKQKILRKKVLVGQNWRKINFLSLPTFRKYFFHHRGSENLNKSLCTCPLFSHWFSISEIY